MASHLNPSINSRADSFSSRPMQFQRKKGKTRPKKIQRKIRLKFKHIFFLFLFFGGIFYSFQRLYLFLISWENLNVKGLEIVCQKPEIREEIQQVLKGKNMGNLLLLDISHLQEALTVHRWIKEVRVRKIFPSTLKIEIKERIPIAVLKKDYLYIIDKEGIQLEKINSRENINLPLLIDSNNFQNHFEEKLYLAWKCLRSLSPQEKERLDVIDLSEYENISVQLKTQHTRLILGSDKFSQKLELFQKSRAKFEKYGNLEYVDLRFQDRFYIKPIKNSSYMGNTPNSKKEDL